MSFLALFAAQAGAGILSGLQERKQLAKQNEIIAKQNIAKMRSARETAVGFDVTRDFYRRQSTGLLQSAREAALATAGTATAQAAAAGVRGASVDAIQMEVERELDENLEDVRRSHIQQEWNINQQAAGVLQQAVASQQAYNKIPSVGKAILSGLLQGAVKTGSAYASAQFKFGAK